MKKAVYASFMVAAFGLASCGGSEETVEEVVESVEGLDEFDGDFIYVNADRSELSNLLLSELKSDGFYKKNKVSLILDSKGVKINGKKPS